MKKLSLKKFPTNPSPSYFPPALTLVNNHSNSSSPTSHRYHHHHHHKPNSGTIHHGGSGCSGYDSPKNASLRTDEAGGYRFLASLSDTKLSNFRKSEKRFEWRRMKMMRQVSSYKSDYLKMHKCSGITIGWDFKILNIEILYGWGRS